SSPPPPKPFPIESEARNSSEAPKAAIVPKASNAPPPVPPVLVQAASGPVHPIPPPVNSSDSPHPPRRVAFSFGRAWRVVAATAVVLVVAGIVGIALIGRKSSDASPSSTARPADLLPGTAQASRRLRLLVPAYFYPAGEGMAEWNKLLAVPDPWAVVIIV